MKITQSRKEIINQNKRLEELQLFERILGSFKRHGHGTMSILGYPHENSTIKINLDEQSLRTEIENLYRDAVLEATTKAIELIKAEFNPSLEE